MCYVEKKNIQKFFFSKNVRNCISKILHIHFEPYVFFLFSLSQISLFVTDPLNCHHHFQKFKLTQETSNRSLNIAKESLQNKTKQVQSSYFRPFHTWLFKTELLKSFHIT